MKINNILFILILLTSSSFAMSTSSWYVVENYEGSIGEYPVHMSLQMEDTGGEFNVSGSYYYDSHNASITLLGIKKQENIILCEINSVKDYNDFIVRGLSYDVERCPFSLTKASEVLSGTWDNKKKNYPVSLRKVSSMDPSSIQGKKEGEIDIPFWGQTSRHSFVGVYEEDKSKLSINRVNVVDKNSGQVIQTIDPQKYHCQFGFYMTDIYRNVESDIDKSRILFNCMSTERDVSTVYQWNSNKKAYVVVKE